MVNAGKDGRAEVGTGGDQGVVRPTVAAGAWAAFLVAAADLTVTGLRLTLIPDPEIALYLTGLAVLGGAVAGLGAASILTVLTRLHGSRPRLCWRSPAVLLAAAGLFSLLLAANSRLFEGAGISSHPRLSLIKAAFYGAALIASFIAARIVPVLVSRGRRGGAVARVFLMLVFLAAAAALYSADLMLFARQYAFIHLQLAVLTVACAACALLVGGPPRYLSCGGAVTFAILLVGGSFLLRTHDAFPRIRAEAQSGAPTVGRWIQWPESLFDRLVSRPGLDESSVEGLATAWAISAADERQAALELDRLVPGRRQMNLLVVSIDTLRADHVGHLGYERSVTPHLDRLAERSLVFEQAYTPYPTSAWAYSSFFTGRYPSASPMGQVSDDASVKIDREVTLAGMLSASGIRTHGRSAFNRATLARRDVFGHLREGFDTFNPQQPLTARDADALTPSALSVLKTEKDPFFLWVHYLEPHDPYENHSEFGLGSGRIDRYDSEIAKADAQLGLLLKALDERGLTERTVVVVMSDHGEEFQEHDGLLHNSSLYEEQVRVPLVICVPGLPPRRIATPVSLVDFMPTMAALFSLKDDQPRNGQSLWPLIFNPARAHPPVFAELRASKAQGADDLSMILFQGRKLIRNERRRLESVFDLASDPREKRNTLGDAPESDAVLRGLLRAARDDAARVLGRSGGSEDAFTAPALRARMAAILKLAPKEMPKALNRFYYGLIDPVEGLDPALRALLQSDREILDELSGFLVDTFAASDPRIAVPWLRVVESGAFEAPAVLLEEADSEHPLVRPRLLYTRAALGAAARPGAIEQALAEPGTRDQHLVVAANWLHGTVMSGTRTAAVLRVRAPGVLARLIPALGAAGWPALLETIDLMMMEKTWSFEPVKRAVVETLAVMPESERRDRLLACYASDLHPRIAALARRLCNQKISARTRAAWLSAGASEVEARRAGRGRALATADEASAAALVTAPAPADTLVAFRARVKQSSGDLRGARSVLAGAPSTPLISRRREHLAVLEPLFFSDPSVAIQKASAAPRMAPNALYFVDFVLENRSNAALLGGADLAATRIEAVFLDQEGREAETSQSWPALLGLDDLAPGEKRSFSACVAAPRTLGTYRLALRLVQTAPMRARSSTPLVVGRVEVVNRP